jgi:hypothetical protein
MDSRKLLDVCAKENDVSLGLKEEQRQQRAQGLRERPRACG